MQLTLDIPNEQVAALDRLSEEKQTPRDELVKLALTIYLSPERKPHPLDFFGAWKDFPEDGQAFQDRMRHEWVREWDPHMIRKYTDDGRSLRYQHPDRQS